MIFHLFCLLVGYTRIWVKDRREALTTLFLRKKINVANGRREAEGGYSFIVPLYEKKQILKLLSDYHFTVESTQNGGLPPYVWSFRKRVGLILGIFSAAGIIVAGSLFLWNVRIVGCKTVSEDEIRKLLQNQGVEVGAYIPPIDAKVAAEEVLLQDPRIAFLAINIIGTTCEVQVTESKFASPPQERLPASIIAAYDGLIERVEVYDGQLTVQHGEAVRKGQVLISGLCDAAEGTYRLETASGVVIAKVEREFTVEVPLIEEVVEKKSGEIQSKSLIFFKKSIKLSKSSSILPPTYGTIIKKEAWTLPGGLVLPVAMETTEIVRYEKVTRRRTYMEAEALALDRMESLVARELQTAELLTLAQCMEHTDNGVRLTWQVYCLMDIGIASPMVGLPE